MRTFHRTLLAVCAVLAALCTVSCTEQFHSRRIRRPVGLGLGLRAKSTAGMQCPDNKCRIYETYYIEQKIDHYGFINDDTFKMRYLVAQQYWDKNGGPIFFYTGNEGDITWFCDNTGFMWDIAPEFKAMLVFAEHRYYGESLPYGKESYMDREHLGYLTSEQALADYAVLIKYIKSSIPGAASSPVVAFGGSYGGMLAAWMRMKYPDAVVGSIAASAPIWSLNNLTNCNTQFTIITKDFTEVSPTCSKTIRASWAVIDKFGLTAEGKEQLRTSLRLCSPVLTGDDVAVIKDWLTETWFNLAMVDYPYNASFLEPLPAFPIEVVCSHIKSANATGVALLEELAEAVNVYYNYTGSAKCFNTSQTATGSLGDKGWGFQACTEMVMPSCMDGKQDMFEPSPWVYEAYVKECQADWNVTPRPDWPIVQYWGKNISAASNIVFSNGLLDPWSAGGVLKSISDTVVAVIIPEGAHHLDLRSHNKDDPPSVIAARNTEKANIKKWIAKAHGNL
ncbi:lysosomal Pro-X carboxypeptidase-like [Patiria miniata]|uniref:Lysosomal Pro-X carboxypeptidase n=1 Tax=Patiria miniata TaxID=46514 RepID=A0A913ZVN2_PATMI|nr:lysosomal Pro-X carboxypeptidase-like [Patiria miniata]